MFQRITYTFIADFRYKEMERSDGPVPQTNGQYNNNNNNNNNNKSGFEEPYSNYPIYLNGIAD